MKCVISISFHRGFQIEEKPPELQREHPAVKKTKNFVIFFFVVWSEKIFG
jgi:hypothetical protein